LHQPGKVIAVLAANPALSSVLTMVLAGDSRLRVREFESEIALAAYMRIAPVDVLVVDFDRNGPSAAELVTGLRADPDIADPRFRVIGLTRTIARTMRRESLVAGIDEIIIKPMSPRHLLQRVVARLRQDGPFVMTPAYRGPDRRNRLPVIPAPHRRRLGDNVIELFPDAPGLPPV
jgi:two-component system phosphate regulon response regulator PhoB